MHPPTVNIIWVSLVNVFEHYGLNMRYINAPTIILGIINHLVPDNNNDQVILFYINVDAWVINPV